MPLPPVVPVSAPPGVRARLLAAPDGPVPVVHRGDTALYVAVEGRCVGVVGTRATGVPCALRLAGPELPFAGRTAAVRSGVLHVDGVALVPGRLLDVRVPHVSPDLLATVRRDQAERPATAHGEPLGVATVARLVGAGDGLTPYGDDVLCGWLALHRAAGVATPEVDAAVAASRHRTTLLSATLLECAVRGEALPEFVAWLAALGGPDEPERRAALRAVGHSSGAGLLAGARWALADLSPIPFVRTHHRTGVPA